MPRRSRAALGRRRTSASWLASCLALCAATLWAALWITSVQAQTQGSDWSDPYRLSSEAGKASEGYLVTDQFGYVHCLWTETLFEDQRNVIKYARFDGTAWSTPNDIYVTGAAINSISPAVDSQGILHILWNEGVQGPAYYSQAPAYDAIRAQNWTPALQVDIPANSLKLQVDSSGQFHLVYIDRGTEPGVYYVRSEDAGQTWSKATWLDPDILPDHIPDSLSFVIDEADHLHVAWFYGALSTSSRPDWVRYAHSLDGGHTWSAPFLIDQYAPEGDHNLTTASPVMTVQGQNVHILWAAGSLPYRLHRLSTDGGLTWNMPKRIFGDLHGQAFDGLAIDGAGRVHFFGQIRYPMGIYHAYWNDNQWTSPSLIYRIAGLDEPIGDHIHAHALIPVVRAGNQLVLTFTDGPADPERRLFAMYRTLDDIASVPEAIASLPSRTAVPISGDSSLETGAPGKVATPAPLASELAEPLAPTGGPDRMLRVALAPTLVLLMAAVTFRLIRKWSGMR